MGREAISLSLSDDIAVFSTVTVGLVSITLLSSNILRLGYSVSNLGSRDVLIRYKGTGDNNLDGFILEAGATQNIQRSSYYGEISAIRRTTTGALTSNINITEW